VTAQGDARVQYRRAIERKNLMGAEMALREMGSVTLDEALDYVALLAELRPGHAGRAAVRWHGPARDRGADAHARRLGARAGSADRAVPRRPGSAGASAAARETVQPTIVPPV
jgi:hypothetical protein